MLLEILLFLTAASATTTLVATIAGVPRLRGVVGLPPAWCALAVAALVVAGPLGDRTGATVLGAVAAALTLGAALRRPLVGTVSVQLLGCLAAAAAVYVLYAAVQTADQAAAGPAVIAGSIVLLLMETAALALTVSYAFEVVDVLGRPPLSPPVPPDHPRLPAVAVQVPTYSEPVEVVQRTLESLARVDYPSLLVQVVDNNTTDPALWRPLERLCARLGPRFSFIHLESWPGFKAGALNEATRRLPAGVEVVAIVDADYVVAPDFLAVLAPHFSDPRVAFVQSAQHYRDWEDDAYLRGLFYSYRYFFDVTMPARAHRNAIIFCGTMGLIRRSTLEEIGGWNQACITEDAEASLRMLGLPRNLIGIYDPRPRGAGLMPLTFDGLKKQRFRWALGGVQILRMHARELLPFTRHRTSLTPAQRLHYLLGSLQWFGDLLTAAFTVLLLATAAEIGLHHRLPVRQLTGAVLVVPLVFLGSGMLRALWALRRTARCTWGDAARALRVWFALSWVVSLACLRGLVSSRAEFLRTPKRRDGAASLLNALRTSRGETVLVVAAVAGAAAMLVRDLELTTAVLAALLLFEAGLYANAPWASIAAEGVPLTSSRRAQLTSPQTTGERPAWRAPAALSAALVAATGAAAALLWATSSPADQPPFGGSADLPPIGSLAHHTPQAPPSPASAPSPTPSPSAAASSPSPTVTPSPAASASASPSAAPSPSATPPPSPSPSP